MSEQNPPTPQDAIARGHEPDTVDKRVLRLSGAGLVLLVPLGLLLVLGMLRLLDAQHPTASQPPVAAPPKIALGPELSGDQSAQLRALHEAEEERLNHYQWIDQPGGVAQIPIARAMEILAKQGLPATTAESEKSDGDKPE
jgi:hypothetical protein